MTMMLMRRMLLLAAVLVATAGIAAGVLAGAMAGSARASDAGGARPGVAAVPAATDSQAPGSPSPTAAPTTAAPTSSAPAPPSSAAASASPSSTSATPSPTGSSGSSGPFSLVWLWIALAVIAVIALIVAISQVGRGRADRRRAWRTRAADAYARGTSLTQSVQGASQASQYRDPSAGARWGDVQRRAEDLTRALQSLREIAPTTYDRARVDDVLNTLAQVQSASQAADPSAANRLQARIRDFEDSLQALRNPERD
ncbi:MAG TPA: hypothetical protein VH089_05230 [Streptosporangiaceae bacterium]|jgi:Tfp pilus assembly protein FimT|nr:hypothetical protein [Streptosporangiaceae bacterium]